jgi:flagellar protein FliL
MQAEEINKHPKLSLVFSRAFKLEHAKIMSSATTSEDTPHELEEGLTRKKWSGKKIVLIALPILLLAIGGGAAAVLGVFNSATPEEIAAKKAEEEKKAAEEADKDKTIVYVDIPDILVNLSGTQGRGRFLKLSISLEVKGEKHAEDLKQKLPRITDNFQLYLREMRVEDLSGSAGVFMLKEELLRRVNTEIAPERVEDVLFKEILVQ